MIKRKAFALSAVLILLIALSLSFAACDDTEQNEQKGLPDIVNIPEGLFIKDRKVINYNGSAENLVIPAGVTEIDAWAFWDCASLKTVFIPWTVEAIGYEAFKGCSNLETIYCEFSIQPVTWSKYWKSGCGAKIVWDAKPN
ncbi:MAG: leucine-rich repeat protein [Clostridiales bacterium]|nr:leucine-rich repeat protein [Clostridiales bacterium]